MGSKELGGRVAQGYVVTLTGWAYQLVSPIGGQTILEQLIWSLSLAMIGFILLRLLSGLVLTDVTLRTVGGILAVVAFPLACVFAPFGLISPNYRNPACSIGLTLELAVVLILGALYYLRKPAFSLPMMAAILFFHFGVWAWVTSSHIPAGMSTLRGTEYYHPWRRTLGVLAFAMAFNFGFPVIGFLAGLSWARFVRLNPKNIELRP